uniref:Tenascin C n=1 Tax=Denticeps clupeoides TaxID=299321 RepID=A0AAY4EAD1_9TELE
MGSSCWLIAVFVVVTILDLSNTGLVKKMLRHRRETLTSAIGENITLPRPDLPVVFNHVYNINVPAGSLCSVDLDSPGDSELEPKDAPYGSRITEPTLNGENQIVFTHRINIPKQACGCSDGLPDLKDLLSRLEVLEGEISSLREQCMNRETCLIIPIHGQINPYCNGRGNFSTEICGCICEPGWRGPNCTEQECPDNCSDQGRCVDSKCECFPGFSGADCSQRTCPVNCGRNGRCVDGLCVCAKGFSGHDCSETDCLNNCLGRGTCKDGDCVCDLPWAGFDCSELICPNDCYDRGRCNNGTCECDEGFTGADCSEYGCPKKCLGRGFCLEGRCVCSAGYTGQDCSELTCLHDCSGRGRCAKGICICDAGFHGEDCSQLSCPNNCNYRGRCINGRCTCDAGFQGEDCSELSCPNDCQHRGRCVNGQCVCNEGYTGEDCSIRACPNDCSGRGHCKGGQCLCHPDFTGEDCSQLSCSNNCQNRGRCVAGQCVCDMGFAGEDCSLKACLNGCLGRGQCVDGRCVCQEGYAGEDCSEETCPAHCNDRGRCINRACVCDAGYAGPDCRHLSCPNNCNDQGQCVNGQCVCDEGYVGYDCSQVSAPKDLTVTDVNAKSVNLTWMNEMLVTEYLVTYAPTAPGGLRHEFTVPGDRTATTIGELEPGIEYMINVYAVLNNKKSIPVSARVATYLPQPDGLKFKSVRETSVEVSWDQLDNLFDKWELTFRKMDEDNGKIVNTLNPEDTSFTQHGLGPGQEYEVSVGIVKNNTRGPPVTRTVLTRIDAPQQVEVRDVTDTFGLISWSQPVAEIDRITLSFGPTSDSSDRTVVHLSSSDSQYKVDGLTPDTEYEVLLVSRRGGVSSEPASKNFITDLDAPRDVQVVGHTENSITLEWMNSQAPVDGYRLKYGPVSTSAHSEDQVSRGPGYTTRATLTGLKPGTEYGIGVTGVKRERESLPATANAVTDLDAPRDLEVADSTETSMTLVWKRPRAKISNYRLVFVSADGRREEVDVPSAATTYTLNNLTPGVRYSISLTAERGRKKSEPAMLSASTGESFVNLPYIIPVHEDLDGLTLTWSAPDGVFDGFRVELKHLSNNGSANVKLVPGGAKGAQIGDLKPGMQYEVSLYGMVDGEQSPPVLVLANTTKGTMESPTMGSLTVSDVSWDSFNVSWTVEEDDFESFVIEVENAEGGPERQNLSLSGDALSLFMSGLSPSTTYLISLYGVYRGSVLGPLFAEATTAAQPDLSGLVVSNITSDRLSLLWRTGEKAFDNFIVEVRESALPSQAMGRTLPGGARSTVLTGLKGNTRYNIKLYANSGGQNTAPLTAVATTEAKPKLGRLSVSKININNFTLAWRTVSGHFDGFDLRVTDRDMLYDTVELRPSGNMRKVVVGGLVDSTTYDIELYGLSHGRRTPMVSTQTTTEFCNHCTHPVCPLLQYPISTYTMLCSLKKKKTLTISSASLPKVENLTVSDITAYGFRVSWAPQDGGQPARKKFSHFHIELSDSGRLLEPQEYTVPGNQTSMDIWGLITGIGYEVKLTGVTVSGLRSRPLTTVAVTEAEPEIEHLFVSDVTPESFRLAWTAEEDVFDRFVIKVRDSRKLAHPQEYNVAGDERTKVLTNLMGGTEYDIELYGVTLEHRSQPITAVARTGLGTPRGIRFSEITDTSGRVHWTIPHAKVDTYRVTYRPLQEGNPTTVIVDGTDSQTILPNLIPGETYHVTVTAVKGLEESDPVTDTLTTALDMPRSLTAVNITDSDALLLWQPSVATVDGYVITYTTDTGTPMVERVSGNIVEFEMNSLTPASQYIVNVYGTKGDLKSPSATTEFTTDVDPPRDLAASNIQRDSAVLTWQPPRATITGYILYFESSDGSLREVVLDPTVTSYNLAELSPSTVHNVRLQAVAGAQRSRSTYTVFTTVGMLYRNPKDCSQTLLNGDPTSGLHTIYLGGKEDQPQQVYCDMTSDGGGWLVILRRLNGATEFFRNWRNYTNGFGDMKDEFWLGLSSLHKITSAGHYELRVDLRDGAETVYAQYDKFYVAEPRTRYKLQIGAYSGTAGDSMSYHQNRPFSTYDNDNDIAVTNCALSYKGAFWYKNCHRVNLMGRYGDNSHSKGINWFHWKGHEHSIPFAEMKIRPVDFRNLEGRRKRS